MSIQLLRNDTNLTGGTLLEVETRWVCVWQRDALR